MRLEEDAPVELHGTPVDGEAVDLAFRSAVDRGVRRRETGMVDNVVADARISIPICSQGRRNVLPSAALNKRNCGPYRLFLCVLPNVAGVGCTKDAVLNQGWRCWCA